MKMDARCTYCLLSRVHYEAKLSTNDDELIHKTMLAGIDVLKDTYVPGVPAGVVSTAIHRKAYEVLNDDDPYLDLKILSNEIAEKVYPYAHSLVHEGEPSDLEMFRRAVLASVIGNFFDFGIMGFDVGEDVFDRTFADIFRKGLDVDDTPEMFDLLDNVVYVVDNCGEIILDTLVLDIIRKVGGKITLVVRGAPMLTDVTMDDVRKYELDKKVDRVLTTGCNAIACAMEGLLTPETAQVFCGPGLAEVCETVGIPPVLHLGSCVDNSRILLAATEVVKAGGLGNDISDLPAAGSAPEWMSEKAISIGHYFVVSGVYTVFGVTLPTSGAPVFHDYICKELENIYGGMWDIEPDPIKHAWLMIDHIDKKRKALGIDKARERVLMDMADRQALEA